MGVLEDTFEKAVHHVLMVGFGDINGELTDDEYVRETRSCPHGCGWEIVTEVRSRTTQETTRLRGRLSLEEAAHDHLSACPP